MKKIEIVVSRNISFEYSEFYKVDLTNDNGQDFSIILCIAFED